MKKVFIVNIIVLLLGLTAMAQNKLRVAVFDPTSSSASIDAGTKEAVREVISDVFVNTGKYSMVERSMLQSVMKEQSLSNTDAFDESKAAELGKMAGANKIVLSVISAVNGRNMVSLKIIDVKTSNIEQQRVIRDIAPRELLNSVETATLEILGEKVIVKPQPKKDKKADKKSDKKADKKSKEPKEEKKSVLKKVVPTLPGKKDKKSK